MTVSRFTALSLAIMAAPAVGTQSPANSETALAPFSAHYQADWKTINVGTSDLELKP